MINLQVKRNLKLPIDKADLMRAAQVTFDAENVNPSAEVSIVIGNDALLKNLNSQYRHIDTATDVLSFPANESDPETNSMYLGDVIISLPRAQEQALVGGHSVSDELQLLVVHGILHLLWYDHLDKSDKKKMQASQEKILSLLGVHLANTL